MAGLGRKVFNAGEVLSAANVQGYLQDQVVQVYSGTAARSSALGTAVSEGMMSYLTDSNELSVYTSNGTAAWSPVNLAQSPNAIINGAFDINQRNFTSTTSNGAFGFDRWYLGASDGTTTYSAQTFTPGTAPVAGYEGTNYARLVSTGQTLGGAFSRLHQKIEDIRTFAGQTVTLSFFAKAASGTPKIAASFYTNFGSGGSAGADVLGGTVTLSTSWTRYSLTIAIPSVSGKTIGTGSNLETILWTSSGASQAAAQGIGIQSNTFDIWGVQLEAGSVATPFRRSSPTLQGELAACQRYYERVTATSTFAQMTTLGMAISSTVGRIPVQFLTPKRVTPTSIEFGGSLSFSDFVSPSVLTNITLDGGNTTNMRLAITSSSLTQYRPYSINANNDANAYIAFSAEL